VHAYMAEVGETVIVTTVTFMISRGKAMVML
jgi:hypothetical protein